MPDLGRFISKDPIGFAGGDTNLYSYVGQNPVNFVDPWGLAESIGEYATDLYSAGTFPIDIKIEPRNFNYSIDKVKYWSCVGTDMLDTDLDYYLETLIFMYATPFPVNVILGIGATCKAIDTAQTCNEASRGYR